MTLYTLKISFDTWMQTNYNTSTSNNSSINGVESIHKWYDYLFFKKTIMSHIMFITTSGMFFSQKGIRHHF